MKKRLMVLAGAFLLGLSVYSQSGEKVVKSRLGVYFSDYQTSYTTATDRCKIDRVKVDASVRTVEIYLNELFAGQSFSRDKVKGIYRDVKRLLPAPYNAYTIIIYGNGISIENLVTDMSGAPSEVQKKWEQALYSGAPWVNGRNAPILSRKVCNNAICLFGPVMDVITRTTKKSGHGNDRICIARLKICSLKR